MYSNVPVCLLVIFFAWHIVYLFYVMAWILSYACGVQAPNIVEKPFAFKLDIREPSLGTPAFLACGCLGVLQPI
jgi:hypothetical protein